MSNAANTMMFASIAILLLGAACASSAPPMSPDESTGEAEQGLTTYVGNCGIDANDNLTGYCISGSYGGCSSFVSTSCPAGQHVTDPGILACGYPIKIKNVSTGMPCKKVL